MLASQARRRFTSRPLTAVLALSVLPVARAQEGAEHGLEKYLELCAAHGWSGVALVEKGGETLLHRGFGLADRATQRENAEGTIFEIASATKPFTACAILALAEDGALDLDDSIAKHLPGVPDDRRSITVRHLLAHTSGMPRRAADGYGDDLERAVTAYLATPPVRKPGEGYEYWNGGYALLAGIVERASGTSYADYCRDRLFERAGLEATGFTGDSQFPEDRQAVGYGGERALRHACGHPYGSYGYHYRGMGGIVTCARDLVRFTEALEAGTILSPETVEEMRSYVTEAYGLGWAVTATERGTRRIGHGGDVAGFHTQWLRFPDEDAHVIVLSNVDGIPIFKLAWSLESILFGESLRYAAPPEPAAVTDRELDALAGRYVLADGGALLMSRAGKQLLVEVADLDPSTLEAVEIPSELEEHAERAQGILQSVRDGDTGAIEKILGPRIPSTWPFVLTNRIWMEHLDRFGQLEGAAILEVLEAGTDGYNVRFRLEHEHATRPLTIGLRGGKLVYFSLAGPLDHLGGSYVRREDGTFLCFDWNSPVPCTLRFEEGAERPESVVASGPGGPPRRLTRER